MSEFKKTEIQKQAIDLLGSLSKYIALFGGSRSGKTFIIIYAIIVRASRVTSNHAIIRLKFNAVKRSIWQSTLPKVLKLCFPDLKVKWNKTDFILELSNGSKIMVLGLDDPERAEKILGLEFSTIYINECSQVPYNSVQIALTRLAEKNNLKKKAYFDFNPPTKSHWSYYLFIKKLDPIENVPVKSPENFVSLLMNPKDNMENIDEDYLKILQAMPEKERKRFEDGEFNDESDGQVYSLFRRERHIQEFTAHNGIFYIAEDFNVNPGAAIIFQFINDKIYVVDEVFLENSNTFLMANEFKRKGYAGCSIIPDSTGGNRKTSGQSDFEILKENGFAIIHTLNPFVTDRINNVNRLFLSDSIIIHPRAKKLINDLEKVVWKDNKPDQSGANKMLTHISDTLGYACWKMLPLIKIREQRTIDL